MKSDDLVDENRYSRQLYTLGFDAQIKLQSTRVLIVGVGGLGAEIAKNLVLTGVKEVSLHDDQLMEMSDLSSQLFLNGLDLGKPRSLAASLRIAELAGEDATISVVTGPLLEDSDTLAPFQVIIDTGSDFALARALDEYCRSFSSSPEDQKRFIWAGVNGVCGFVFNDFGESFLVLDPDCEDPTTYMIASITQDNPAVVSVIEDVPLHLDPEFDAVRFQFLEGMAELNYDSARDNIYEAVALDKYQLALKGVDGTQLCRYSRGGYMIQNSLERMSSQPGEIHSLVAVDDSVGGNVKDELILLAYRCLWLFLQDNRRMPSPHCKDDADEIVSIAQKIVGAGMPDVDVEFLRMFSYTAAGDLCPLASYIGGIAAMEVIKAATHYLLPMRQWYCFQAKDILPPDFMETVATKFSPIGSRYDRQIMVLGMPLQQKLEDLNYFLVGLGGVGCEFLKNCAMMGIASSEKGRLHITDPGLVLESSLSNQLLYRTHELKNVKDKSAAQKLNFLNPNVNVSTYSRPVGPDSDSWAGIDFYRGLHGVFLSIDDSLGREEVRNKCVLTGTAMLEANIVGTRANSQVLVPNQSQPRNLDGWVEQGGYLLCEIRSFSNKTEHTVEWAREFFVHTFVEHPETVNLYIHEPNFFESFGKKDIISRMEILKALKICLVSERPLSYPECIAWARLQFEELFVDRIMQFLYNYPEDLLGSDGVPFWRPPRRCPHPLEFDINNSLHMEFIISAARLRAINYGISVAVEKASEEARAVLPKVMVPEFIPQKLRISTTDEEDKQRDAERSSDAEGENMEELDYVASSMLRELPTVNELSEFRMFPTPFARDDSLHISFVTAASALRAEVYRIASANKHRSRRIAGRIVPSLVTSAAAISGLQCLEMLKVLQDRPLLSFRNFRLNLGPPSFHYSPPPAVEVREIRKDWHCMDWDHIDILGDITIAEFIEHFKSSYELEVSMISCDVSLLYSFFMPVEKRNTRLSMKISETVESVLQQKIPAEKKQLVLVVCCTRLEDDEDVDIPNVIYYL